MTKDQLKIIFLGTPEFAVKSLDALVTAGFNVVATVTATDKPAGRGHKMLPSAVKQYSLRHGIPVLQPERLKDSVFIEQLRAYDADLFVVIAFRMLPEAVWQMPRLGTFNLHASLLPKYRGAAPINRAVMNGETETGVTTFFLKHEIDTGDIIAQERIAIAPDENVGSVHDRLMELGAKLTLQTVNDILDNNLHPIPQQLLTSDIEPTPAPKIFREDCKIEWDWTVDRIHNHIRGLSPYPGAWTPMLIDGKPADVKILEGAKRPDLRSHPNGYFEVECADGSYYITKVQIPGKRPMSITDIYNGHIPIRIKK